MEVKVQTLDCSKFGLPNARLACRIFPLPGGPMEPIASFYRFGPYELRVRTRELYKQGVKLRLRPQPFHILKLLVERAGDLVTREELRDSVWSKETFVDFE